MLARTLLGASEERTHHDNSASGLAERARPMVDGRVACSIAYAMPVALNNSARRAVVLSDILLSAAMLLASELLGAIQKFTVVA